MTTPNDPYNSANPRPFDDDHILEPIVEKTERTLPETPAEEIANDTVETDNAPDFGDVPPLPQEEKPGGINQPNHTTAQTNSPTSNRIQPCQIQTSRHLPHPQKTQTQRSEPSSGKPKPLRPQPSLLPRRQTTPHQPAPL